MEIKTIKLKHINRFGLQRVALDVFHVAEESGLKFALDEPGHDLLFEGTSQQIKMFEDRIPGWIQRSIY